MMQERRKRATTSLYPALASLSLISLIIFHAVAPPEGPHGHAKSASDGLVHKVRVQTHVDLRRRARGQDNLGRQAIEENNLGRQAKDGRR